MIKSYWPIILMNKMRKTLESIFAKEITQRISQYLSALTKNAF